MLPSLNAGTFEGGRPQIVFERGIVIEPELRVCVYDCAIIAACGGNGGWMPKVSTKHVQRRIAELDSVAQPKRSSVLKRVLAFIILAIIAVAAFFSANRTLSDFLRLTLKQGSAESNRQLSDAEARAK
jgi:hypothetical protein